MRYHLFCRGRVTTGSLLAAALVPLAANAQGRVSAAAAAVPDSVLLVLADRMPARPAFAAAVLVQPGSKRRPVVILSSSAGTPAALAVAGRSAPTMAQGLLAGPEERTLLVSPDVKLPPLRPELAERLTELVGRLREAPSRAVPRLGRVRALDVAMSDLQ